MARVLSQRGLSLAEVLIAMGLIVVAILTSIALSISASRSHQKSGDLALANGYASQVMDDFLYGLPASSDPFWGNTSFSDPYLQDQVNLGGKDFNADLHLESLASVTPGLLRCTVNVTWQSGVQGQAGQGLQVTQVSRLIYGH